MSIYVEHLINADPARIFHLTQTPELHERWDLRFTSIHYLPKTNLSDPQNFEYQTRVAPGLTIRGTGQTTASRPAPDKAASSALQFASPDPRSIIKKGAGYWQYSPTPHNQTRFITAYDYAVRWGFAGKIIDRFFFRPAMAWATAWSFHRLARWASDGISPETSLRVSLAYSIARFSLVFLWLYQGLFPKILGPDPQELFLTVHAGVSLAMAPAFLRILGILECALGLILLVLWHKRWPAAISAVLMLPILVIAAHAAPQLLAAPFNVVTTNLLTAALSVIVILLQPDTLRAGASTWQTRRNVKRSCFLGS